MTLVRVSNLDKWRLDANRTCDPVQKGVRRYAVKQSYRVTLISLLAILRIAPAAAIVARASGAGLENCRSALLPLFAFG